MPSSDKLNVRNSILPKELDDIDDGWGAQPEAAKVFRSSLPPKQIKKSIAPTTTSESSVSSSALKPPLSHSDSLLPLSEPIIRESDPSFNAMASRPQRILTPQSNQVTKAPELPAEEFARNMMNEADAHQQAISQRRGSQVPTEPVTSEQEAPLPPDMIFEGGGSEIRSDLPTQPPPAWFSEQASKKRHQPIEAPIYEPQQSLTEMPPRASQGSLAEEANKALSGELGALSQSQRQLEKRAAKTATNRMAVKNEAKKESQAALSTHAHSSGEIASLEPQKEMNARFAMGDFSGALILAESILRSSPENLEARSAATKCHEVLHDMYLSRLGSLAKIPNVIMTSDQIRWLSLDHKAGFILSMMDGALNIEELLDICGMSQLEALRLLCKLQEEKVISLS